MIVLNSTVGNMHIALEQFNGLLLWNMMKLSGSQWEMVRSVSSLAELKNLFYSRLLFSFPLSVFPAPSLPHSLLFLPLFLQRMLKGNESTLSYICNDAGPCLPIGTAASPWYVKKKINLLTASLWTKESYPGSNVKLDLRRIKYDKHLQMPLSMIRG